MIPDTYGNLSMAGKVAVVTGSTQGLGEAIAHLLADRGAKGMVICGRNEANGAKVKAALEAKGVQTHFTRADLGKVEDAREVIADADRVFGRADVLVNAAGMTDRGTILDTSPELFDQMFAVNLRSPFFLIQDAARLMIRNGAGGAIVNILSVSGHGGQSFISAYCASKGALSVLTKNAAYSLMKNRIRVNGLNIGWMDTPGEDRIMKTYHQAEDGWLQKAEAGRPMGRLLKPAEVARAVGYLATAESGLMTGAIIDFDQQVIGTGDSPPEPPVLTL